MTETTSNRPAVSLKGARKVFGDFVALEEVTFDIIDNEFFTLLGPSGCGKTTLLRMIAGFESASAGSIELYGAEISALPPHKRPVNTVFQNYALFPHMTVAENIGFALKMLGWKQDEIRARVAEMIDLVQLGVFEARKPSQLSGGQQQRVALARAMAPRPKVLLLDEPLSALDLKLRQEMRTELKTLQQETGITFTFVTHDQEEALSMSDRIAVMSAGKVQQIGTPKEIYESPKNQFVADFIGETNFLDAEIKAQAQGKVQCAIADGLVISAKSVDTDAIGSRGVISIRPEHLSLSVDKPAGESLPGTVGTTVYLGTDTQVSVALNSGKTINVRLQNNLSLEEAPEPGTAVFVGINKDAARFLAS